MNYNLYEALKNGANPYQLDADFINELAAAKERLAKEKAEAAEKKRMKEAVEAKRKALKQTLLDFTVAIYREDGQKEMADKLAADPEAVGAITDDIEKELRKIAKITKPIGDLVELLDSLKTKDMKPIKTLKPQTDDEVIKTFIGKL